MRRVGEDWYELSTGRRFYANCGIIGISSDDASPSTKQLSHGYDGGIDVACGWQPEDDWTIDERRELGEFMAALWSEWARGWTTEDKEN